jgi:DNA-binding GntR family transcriptional regulator
MAKLAALTQPQPLARMAYQALKESITSGKLIPGEVYNEMALAKELNISRTPVREALLELSTNGLVTFLPRKGVMINRYSKADVEEIFEVRKAIELFCIEKAALSPERGRVELEESLAAQQQALETGDMSTFMGCDRKFHVTLGHLVGNKRISAILDNLRDMVNMMGLEALTGAGRAELVLAEHKKVFAAIAAGDVPRARQTLEEHLEKSKEAVLRARKNKSEE